MGGCVRDSLLGKTPHDWDVCTSAYPEEMKEIFRTYRVIETGLKHGTLTVLSENKPVEITSFRTDGKYADYRRPENVEFTRSLEQDLKRRDFTVNALCCNRDGKIYDFFSGTDDLKNSVLRAVGDPDTRFNEDALRIIRLARFASVLGFDADAETFDSAVRNAHLTEYISKERIYTEFFKLMSGKACSLALQKYQNIINVFMPGIYQTSTNFSCLSCTDDPEIRLSLLFYKRSEEAIANLKNLKAPNLCIKNVSLVSQDYPLPRSLREMRYMLKNYGEQITQKKLSLAECLTGKRDENLTLLFEQAKSTCYLLSHLDINGNDILNLKLTEQKNTGRALDFLLDSVIDGKTDNSRENLIEFLRSNNHLFS